MSNYRLQKRKFDDKLKQEWLELEKYGSLFNSWAWCYYWWDTWAETNNLSLRLYSVHARNGKIIGLFPFYIQRDKKNQLQLIGNIYPSGITILSEYSDIVFDPNFEKEVRDALADYLKNSDWEKVIIPFHSKTSFLAKLCRGLYPYRFITELAGYRVNTTNDFSQYLAKLGKNTRLKLFNRRKYLSEKSEVKITIAENIRAIEQQLNTLNELHAHRWGHDCFDAHSLKFHTALAEYYLKNNNLALSTININDRPSSVVYDLRFNSTEYNIQSGYLEKHDPKISLGTLHLGYAIEAAFSIPNKYFDLLMGEGKNSNYKESFRGLKVDFETTIIFKHPIYKIKDFINRIISKLSRYLVKLAATVKR